MDQKKLERLIMKQYMVLLGIISLGGLMFLSGMQSIGIYTALLGYPVYLAIVFIVFSLKRSMNKEALKIKSVDPTVEILDKIKELTRKKSS